MRVRGGAGRGRAALRGTILTFKFVRVSCYIDAGGVRGGEDVCVVVSFSFVLGKGGGGWEGKERGGRKG